MKRIIIALIATVVFVTSVSAQEVETRSLDELYAAAIKEGGKLVIWSGGDKPGQRDQILTNSAHSLTGYHSQLPLPLNQRLGVP